MKRWLRRQREAAAPGEFPARLAARGALLGYGYLALLALASSQLARLFAGAFALAGVVLALPVALALAHASTVRRLSRLHRFDERRVLHRFAARRFLSTLVTGAVAFALACAVLLQSAFFGVLEWTLLAAAPVLYVATRAALDPWLRPQFARAAYAQPALAWIARVAVAGVLACAWWAARLAIAEAPPQPLGEVVFALQARWADAPSGLVRWALDAGAVGQATLDAVGHLPDAAGWRAGLLLVLAPLSVLAHVALALSGLAMTPAELRRTLGTPLTDADQPPPVGAARAAIVAAFATVGALIAIETIALASARMDPAESPFALRRLPECERIGGAVYLPSTIALVRGAVEAHAARLAAGSEAACRALRDVDTLAAAGVDRYLDWYFSLGAEYARLGALLAGGIDALLEDRFAALVFGDPVIRDRLAQAQAGYERVFADAVAASDTVRGLLDRQRLVVDASQCRVVGDVALREVVAPVDRVRERLAGGAGAGLVAGALAGKVAAKAMGKTGMKAAAKVLAKAAAKKGIGVAGAAGIGAAAGSVLPGAGTALGALAGAAAGLAFGAAVDIAALAAEEKLTRDDLRAELLAAVAESLQPYRDTFDCTR